MQIGVSGATGRLGKVVLDRLKAAVSQHDIVGISRGPQLVRAGVEGRLGDYDHPNTLAAAYAGLDRLLIIPTMHACPRTRSRQIVTAIDAAVEAEVGDIVLLSMVGTREEFDPAVGAASWIGEQRLIRTASRWAILRANYYTESFAEEAELWIRKGAITELGESRVAFVSRDDVAASAAGILVGEGHSGAIYNASGPASISGAERAETISRLTGIPVKFHTTTIEHLHTYLKEAGYPGEYIAITIETKLKCLAGAFDIVTGDVERLSGRPARTLLDVLSMHSRLLSV